MRYDDLYRLSSIEYQYSSGADEWQDPYAAEVSDNTRPQPSPRARFAGGDRPMQQAFAYDWLGNTSQTADDQQAFYDRSLGAVDNAGYQLTGAQLTTGPRAGRLITQYDQGGNLEKLEVYRKGECTDPTLRPTGDEWYQRYEYKWDEVGRLVEALRYERPNPEGIPPPDETLGAHLKYEYDASDQRVRKTVVDDQAEQARHTLYVFGSLELRLAQYDGTAHRYELTAGTEVSYLQAHGVRLARVVHTPQQLTPEAGIPGPTTRVFLELGDQLGSTSAVLDHATGELVERSTAYAYGAVESDYRPDRWGKFREDYRFTGKEEDIEVGLQYFGKRFYAPLLRRWISPDPLAVHAPGQADLNLYAYVHGRTLILVDPVGLTVQMGSTNWMPGNDRTKLRCGAQETVGLRRRQRYPQHRAASTRGAPGATQRSGRLQEMGITRGREGEEQARPVNVKFGSLVRAQEIVGEDAEETAQLQTALGEAESFLRNFSWCRGTREAYLGLGIGGVVAVFLLRIEPSPGADPWLWVIVGDLPSAYLVTDDAPDGAGALEVYCRMMSDWITAVRTGGTLEDVFPVAAMPTEANAALLEKRLAFLRAEVIPAFRM